MKKRTLPGFGVRLATLRQQRGLSQAELGRAVGVSQRVVAYYEGESPQPPGALLVDLARTLQVSTDKLLGLVSVADTTPRHVTRLRKRLQKVETLPVSDQRTVLKLVEALHNTRQREHSVRERRPYAHTANSSERAEVATTAFTERAV